MGDVGQYWTLTWHLMEVVRDELIVVGARQFGTYTPDTPPATFDPVFRRAVVVRVNESGHAEWEMRWGGTSSGARPPWSVPGATRSVSRRASAGRSTWNPRLPELAVFAFVYDRTSPTIPFCRDLGVPGPLARVRWRAVRGRITIEMSERGVSAREPNAYRATVALTGAEFVSEFGGRPASAPPITLSALVGWFVGP